MISASFARDFLISGDIFASNLSCLFGYVESVSTSYYLKWCSILAKLFPYFFLILPVFLLWLGTCAALPILLHCRITITGKTCVFQCVS